jgi:predicted AAA+ superfamily ATPase
MSVTRSIQKRVEEALFKGKIVVVYGARQVGKTTLVKQILENHPAKSLYINCDERDVRDALTDKTSTELRAFLGDRALVVIDEAQRVKNIGMTLRLLADNYPDMQVIAAGSSSFELSNSIAEPLTGRKKEFFLHAFSLEELSQIYNSLEIDRLLEDRLVYGMYPAVVINPSERESIIRELASSYSYKDVLAYQDIRNPELLEKILQALALQIGNEVSYLELAQAVGANKATVESYIRILEQAYIIFRLSPFSRNARNELKRKRKIYFYDLGIRNALINNLNPVNIRPDVGALWENFMIVERMKRNHNRGISANAYFWRTTDGQEIDYVEESAGKLCAYEFKWRKKKASVPKSFALGYPKSEFSVLHRENYREFLQNGRDV